MRITVTGAGGFISLLVLLLFSGFRIMEGRNRTEEISAGEILNAIGFGILPGLTFWKIFEQHTVLGTGTGTFDPIGDLPLFTEKGCFAVSRTEILLAVLGFTAVVLWLAFRKDELPGNSDLLLTVLCLWGMMRAFTEGLRETTLLRAGIVNLTQILMLMLADLSLTVWTVRMEAAQKNTAFAVLEWIAVLSAQAVMVLNTTGVLSAGSPIGDLVVNGGCMLLSLLLILSAGKESRT